MFEFIIVFFKDLAKAFNAYAYEHHGEMLSRKHKKDILDQYEPVRINSSKLPEGRNW